MRSKEVEEAIERIKLHKNMAQTKNDCFITNIINADILLAYIEELEQLPNKIRDEIKELEEEKRKIESSPYDKWDLYKVIGKIEVLKSIIGE